ncbi:type II toxin-antitoxin system RelE/ParE family toxin [Rhodopseudomonas sp. P1]|uniref:type II toxin-antitoxin system RelE/ParE family toxin n=1 Tax=Rhodopseudomonas sp. P1 TaxID=3434357 RepID=UPI0031FDEC03
MGGLGTGVAGVAGFSPAGPGVTRIVSLLRSVKRRFTEDTAVLYLSVHENSECPAQGLRRLIDEDDAGGVQAAIADKLRRMISFLQDMEREDELRTVPSWKAHRLTGDRKGAWSLFVTKNWRLTFQIDKDGIEIIDLDDEDYH